MKIYSIYDRKSNTYGTVFTSDNNQTAQRYFQYLCSIPANELIRDDVELYVLGSFDPKTGSITDVCKDFVSNFVFDETVTNMIRNQARLDFLKELSKLEESNDEE